MKTSSMLVETCYWVTTKKLGNKFSRKKDKRKINLKHCVLRVEEFDMIIPSAKGDFMWVGHKGNLDY